MSLPWHSDGMKDSQQLTAQQFQDIGGLGDWRVLAIGASAWFDAPSHAAGRAPTSKPPRTIGADPGSASDVTDRLVEDRDAEVEFVVGDRERRSDAEHAAHPA